MDLSFSIFLRFLAFCACCLQLWPWAAHGGTMPEYAGAYARPLVWEKTVVMTGDVLILPGGHLTIRAGTEVRVVAAEGTQIDPEYLSSQTELLVRGAIDIEGTQEQPVRFVLVERPELEDFAWAGITLDGAETSTIRHAVIERADTAIRCVSSSPVIAGNQIRNCRYGLVLQQESHPNVLENTIRDGEGGIFCWRGASPYLKYNQILDHDEEGVFVDAESRPVLDRNTISGNDIGLAISSRQLPFDDTEITGNRENVRWLGLQGAVGVSP